MKKLLSIVMMMSMILTACSTGKVNEESSNVKNSNVKSDAVSVSQQDDSLQKIIDKGTIKVGLSADYPPYEFMANVDGKPQISGSDITMAEYIADEIGVKVEYQDMDFKNLIGSLSSGQIDLVISGLSPTPEREKAINLSDLYFQSFSSAVTLDSGTISSENDLEGKNIAVQMGSIQEEYANTIKNANVVSLSTTTDCLNQLKAKKVDAMILGGVVAENYVKNVDGLKLAVEISDQEEGLCIGIKKGNDSLTEKINNIIKKIKEEKLYDKWLVDANELAEESTVD
ncbi:MAG: transporter substrate-binding domain-containing protein [Peptoniphilaceae bacterium]|nr:transporter substrate-binding domain-containing protein [Peptoniphilaceae bacterium]MDY3738656.1 transporter substrate-binding domain-containing protein [Peptoniphilaceae bacterium]